uniref:hypothetical protein n=1 Tax=Goniotrichopsis reniformis TaxID=468933 RepID=UPI001FCE1BBC|nr:hypothetical protein MW428_pgp193 [Goniotrichopsis reniformis]UNJ14705.1 hypothetical protein [Goniotrichopsis reniformis]
MNESKYSLGIKSNLLEKKLQKKSLGYTFAIKSRNAESTLYTVLSSEDMKLMPKQDFHNNDSSLIIDRSQLSKINKNEIVIYKKSSGILSDPMVKDELLTPREKQKRKTMREKFKRLMKTERIHFLLPQRQKGEKGADAMSIKWWAVGKYSPQDILLKVINRKNIRTPGFPTENNNILLSKFEKFPVFTVRNNLRQVILAYPAEEFLKGFSDRLFDWYYRNFEWEADTRATKLGFFFFNPEDAKSYQHTVRQYGPLSAAELGAKVIPFPLSIAYKLNRTSPPETRFMFVPDVKEVGDLLYIYRFRYGNKMQFHPKQKITRDGFASQPIYTIRKTKVRNNFFSTTEIHYEGKDKDREYIFLTLEGAEAAWEKFCESHSNIKLPKKPNLLVYNFEDFLYDCEQDNNLKNRNFLFVSNREGYTFVNKLQDSFASQNRLQKFYQKRLYVPLYFARLWFNRIKLVLLYAPRINEYPRREVLIPAITLDENINITNN